MVTRHRLLAALFVFVGTTPMASNALAQSADTQEAIEARIRALNVELYQLREQLQQIEAPEQSAAGIPAEPLPEEAALVDLNERRLLEQESTRNPFAITTHRTNYIFPFSYNNKVNEQNFREITDENGPDNVEVKFQFSAKFNLVEDLFGDVGDVYFGYTQRSWWQAYNTDASSPFRETNYEPEIFIDFDNAWTALGWVNTRNRVAFNHQSNGRSDPLSRSWNRVYLESTFQRGDWALTLAPHWRVPESDGSDDNPDIERYMGYGDIRVAKRLNGNHEIATQFRGNPSAGNYGTQVDYSWPAFTNLRAHLQYYYGYGESMIDYDNRVHRLSIGFSLNPMFSATGLDR
ncbi:MULTISPECIES: phospholipase A [unclassified Halomonas]|uniref:phospholipase A n=1 Tax=unclassified Halomonas TaxID=2609666 RepID=UPI0020A1672F|nr:MULTISPECIES: phospholipase A [unclassified Halomonas]MCP1315279.1 phospholipase A [Halomonas sp. 707D7]MCP1325352.1 phospholipase A [Halomonas sp. 707D4]